MIKTLKVRVKDKHSPLLKKMAAEVNQVWNYSNELSFRMITERGKWMSGFDFHPYTVGASKEFCFITAATIQECSEEYARKRKQAKKIKLKWRKSFGRNRSLGWVPFKIETTRFVDNRIKFAGHLFDIWDSYDLSQYKFRAGCFTEDARGLWYFCVCVEVEEQPTKGSDLIGIDLGLKTIATCSDGTVLDNERWYRTEQQKLGMAQRAKNKKRARNIHAKIANRRKDALHKFSRQLVNRCSYIVVGNVSSSKLKKTKMAKSVSDAGWSSLKTMLSYKSQQAGIVYKEVNEAFTTQTCSSCGAISHSSPKGRAGLGIREWMCECGSLHNRDINSAINILTLGLGHGPLVEEIAVA